MSKTKTASITIDGDLIEAFDIVRQNMMDLVPGINPNNAEVVRAAMFMAANSIERKKAGAATVAKIGSGGEGVANNG